MNIYIVYCEVKPRAGSQMPDDYLGAFVECYVPAVSENDAIEYSKAALSEDLYELINIDECIIFNDNEWDDNNDPDSEVRNSANEASNINELIYGTFRGYLSE